MTPPRKKAKEKYAQAFVPQWLQDPALADWLMEKPGERYEATCRFCKITFSSLIDELNDEWKELETSEEALWLWVRLRRMILLSFGISESVVWNGSKLKEMLYLHYLNFNPSFVARFHGCFWDDNHGNASLSLPSLYLVMDRYDEDLESFIHSGEEGLFSLGVIRSVMKQLAMGLQYIKRYGIVHRDLKPENILIKKQGNVVLSDFGIAKETIQNNRYHEIFVCTPAYRPPEVIFGWIPAIAAIDMWAFGCIYVEMATRKHLFDPNIQPPEKTFENYLEMSIFENLQILCHIVDTIGSPALEDVQK
ncbi:unnamed protein product [Cyprideis torosa]|uniref:Uncharacterized protein n=1 Tax=Cyprideis torosa TaxID=163714 RepID=A0A7R8W4Q2_9CRUS|nr:unnamed protein product [Cyprideis torosa]CAG0883420.1 unnamed protein product [Cyprideis torosa]